MAPVTDNPPQTDFTGWAGGPGADGRKGWLPDAWCMAEVRTAGWLRDASPALAR